MEPFQALLGTVLNRSEPFRTVPRTPLALQPFEQICDEKRAQSGKWDQWRTNGAQENLALFCDT